MRKLDPQLLDAIMAEGYPTAEGNIGVTSTPGCPCPEDCPCDEDDCARQYENVGQSGAHEASKLVYNALKAAREKADEAAREAAIEDMVERLEAFKAACDTIDKAAMALKKDAYQTILTGEAPCPDAIDVHLEVHVPVNDDNEIPLTCKNLFVKTGPGVTLNFVGAVGDVDITAATGTVVTFEQDVVGDVTVVQGDGADLNLQSVGGDIEIEQGDGSHVAVEED